MNVLRAKLPILKSATLILLVFLMTFGLVLTACVFEAVGPDGQAFVVDYISLKTLEVVVCQDGAVDLSRVPLAGTLVPAVMKLYGFEPEAFLPDTMTRFVRESGILSFRVTKVKDGLTFLIDGQRMLTLYGGTEEWGNFSHWYSALMPADIFAPTIAEVAKLIPLPGFDIVVLFEQDGGIIPPAGDRITSAELEKTKLPPSDLSVNIRVEYDEDGAPSVLGVNLPEFLEEFSLPLPTYNKAGSLVLDEQTMLKDMLSDMGVVIPSELLYLNPVSYGILLDEGVERVHVGMTAGGLQLQINEDNLPTIIWNQVILAQMEAKAKQFGWNPMGLVNAFGRMDVGVTLEFPPSSS